MDGLDEFFRDGTADSLIDDLDALALLVGLNLDDDVAVLTLTTGLTDEFTFTISGLD